jgi:hypothetical protein
MAKGRKETARAARLRALLEAGDVRSAVAEGRCVLADPDAPEGDRSAAREAVGRAAPERAAMVVGAIAVAVSVAVSALVLLHP